MRSVIVELVKAFLRLPGKLLLLCSWIMVISREDTVTNSLVKPVLGPSFWLKGLYFHGCSATKNEFVKLSRDAVLIVNEAKALTTLKVFAERYPRVIVPALNTVWTFPGGAGISCDWVYGLPFKLCISSRFGLSENVFIEQMGRCYREALGMLQSAQIVHRDFCLRNLLFTYNKSVGIRIVILDFAYACRPNGSLLGDGNGHRRDPCGLAEGAFADMPSWDDAYSASRELFRIARTTQDQSITYIAKMVASSVGQFQALKK